MRRVLFVDSDEGVTEAKTFFSDRFGTQLLFARGIPAAMEILKTHEIGAVIGGPLLPESERKFLEKHLTEHVPDAHFLERYLKEAVLLEFITRFLETESL